MSQRKKAPTRAARKSPTRPAAAPADTPAPAGPALEFTCRLWPNGLTCDGQDKAWVVRLGTDRRHPRIVDLNGSGPPMAIALAFRDAIEFLPLKCRVVRRVAGQLPRRSA